MNGFLQHMDPMVVIAEWRHAHVADLRCYVDA